MFLFLGSTLSEPDKFLEHLLRNSNSDEQLNSVISRLERNRQAVLAEERMIEEEECNEPSEVIGFEVVFTRGAWQSDLQH